MDIERWFRFIRFQAAFCLAWNELETSGEQVQRGCMVGLRKT